MKPPKRLLFNAFSMNCVSHIHHGLWRRPDTQQLQYKSQKILRHLERKDATVILNSPPSQNNRGLLAPPPSLVARLQ
jgi:hypothetical protein